MDHMGDNDSMNYGKKRASDTGDTLTQYVGIFGEEKLLRLWKWQNRRFIPKKPFEKKLKIYQKLNNYGDFSSAI